jgi:hypothetical protein
LARATLAPHARVKGGSVPSQGEGAGRIQRQEPDAISVSYSGEGEGASELKSAQCNVAGLAEF